MEQPFENAAVDIVVRLAKEAATLGTYPEDAELFAEAADEIERLRAAGDAVAGLLRCFVRTDTDELAASVLNQWENPQ